MLFPCCSLMVNALTRDKSQSYSALKYTGVKLDYISTDVSNWMYSCVLERRNRLSNSPSALMAEVYRVPLMTEIQLKLCTNTMGLSGPADACISKILSTLRVDLCLLGTHPQGTGPPPSTLAALTPLSSLGDQLQEHRLCRRETEFRQDSMEKVTV